MTQPIDREPMTTPYITQSQLDRAFPVAHSRKDAEPVDIRAAMKRAFNLGQTYWQQADSEYVSQQNKSDATRAKFNELLESTMDHVSNPPEADKLLQQALEALDNSVDVVREEYTEAVRRYSGLPSRKARLDSLNALLTKHESSITDIRTYLEGKK